MLKVLTDGCQPTRGSKYSAGVDLYASETVTISAGETKVIGLGVALDGNAWAVTANLDLDSEFKKSHVIKLYMRSSTASKKGLIMPNGVGVIDLDYRDEIKIILHNPYKNYKEPITINKGDKIAQIMLVEHIGFMFKVDTDKERSGGLGSTGN